MSANEYINRATRIRSMQLGRELELRELRDRICTISDGGGRRAVVVLRVAHNRIWWDVFEYIDAMKMLPSNLCGVVYYFVEEDAFKSKIFPQRVEEFLDMDGAAFIAYDETGTFDDKALLRSSALDIGKTTCSFAGTIGDIDEQRFEDIRHAATLQAEYELARELSEHGFSTHLDGFAMSRMVEAMGMGYVSYPLSRSLAEIINQGTTGSNLAAAPQPAADIVMQVGREMNNMGDIVWLMGQSARVSAAIRIWAAAVRNAGIPFAIDWCNSSDAQWHVDQNMLCKMAELLGVDNMMETHFIHGVPVDDVVA